MRRFTKLWAKSQEDKCKAVVLYDDEENYLCTDANKENRISKDDLVNFFKKGLILVDNGVGTFEKPTAMEVSENYASVTCGESTYYSDGYVA